MALSAPANGVTPAGNPVPERILVTGGAGFIGGNVVARLVLMGAQVKVVDDFSTGCIENLADAADGGLTAADVVEGDIRTPEGVETIHSWQPDVVVHLAAQASLAGATRSPLYDADVNVFGTVNVLDACVQSGVGLFVYAASSAIYGNVASRDCPVSEERRMAAVSPYGISKAAGVCYLDWYRRQHGLDYTSLVFSNIYGPRQSGDDYGVVSLMTHALLGGEAATIHGDGRQTRDFIHVNDAAEAVARACHHEGFGLVNISSSRQTSVNEVFRTVRDATGAETEPRYEPMADPGQVRNMSLDNRKAQDLLGWQPKIGFRQGVQRTVRDARRQLTGTQTQSLTQHVLSGA